MTMLVTIVLVGLGSYALRVVPLLLVDRVQLSSRVQELLVHAVLAAMTALLVLTVLTVVTSPTPAGVSPAAGWVALAAGVVAAALCQSMGRVLLVGMVGYGATVLLTWLV